MQSTYCLIAQELEESDPAEVKSENNDALCLTEIEIPDEFHVRQEIVIRVK